MKVSGTSLAAAAIAALFMTTSVTASPAPARKSPARKGPAPIVVVPAGHAATMRPPPNLAAMFAFVDKLFPPQPDPDPARLALARTAVGAMWPDGAYGKMMSGFMGGMFDRVMQLKSSDLAALSDKPAKTEAASSAKDVSLHDRVAAKDPYFDQRMAAMRDAVNEEMGKISAVIDPRMREGLSRAMARRFDPRQLGDINLFFASPSGQAFAGQYMQLWLDPDSVRAMVGSMPELMKLTPELAEKLKAASDKFPKPPASPAAAKSP